MKNNYHTAPELYKQNPRDRTFDLPFFFLYKHITSLESLPYWFRVTSTAVFVLIYRFRALPMSAVTNRFEMRRQLKQLLRFYYKISPNSLTLFS